MYCTKIEYIDILYCTLLYFCTVLFSISVLCELKIETFWKSCTVHRAPNPPPTNQILSIHKFLYCMILKIKKKTKKPQFADRTVQNLYRLKENQATKRTLLLYVNLQIWESIYFSIPYIILYRALVQKLKCTGYRINNNNLWIFYF